MTNVINYEELAQLQKRYPRGVGNDYMLPAEARALAERGKLFCAADECALFIFERRWGYTKLRFRLRDASAQLPQIDSDTGPLGAYLVYRAGGPPGAAAGWLAGQGFTRAVTLERYTARRLTGQPCAEGTEAASPGEAYAMLGKYFAAPDMDMPCPDMFEGALCVRGGRGEPLGVLYAGRDGVVVAVSPEARNKGAGRGLYLAYAAGKLNENENAVFHEWIRPENAASIAMFKKLGFARDGAVTDCYVRG